MQVDLVIKPNIILTRISYCCQPGWCNKNDSYAVLYDCDPTKNLNYWICTLETCTYATVLYLRNCVMKLDSSRTLHTAILEKIQSRDAAIMDELGTALATSTSDADKPRPSANCI